MNLSATHKTPFPYSISPMNALVLGACILIPSVGKTKSFFNKFKLTPCKTISNCVDFCKEIFKIYRKIKLI